MLMRITIWRSRKLREKNQKRCIHINSAIKSNVIKLFKLMKTMIIFFAATGKKRLQQNKKKEQQSICI